MIKESLNLIQRTLDVKRNHKRMHEGHLEQWQKSPETGLMQKNVREEAN